MAQHPTLTELRPEDAGQYLITTRDSQLILDYGENPRMWRFPGPGATSIRLPSNSLNKRSAIRIGESAHLFPWSVPGDYWSSEVIEIQYFAPHHNESDRQVLADLLDTNLRVDVAGRDFVLSMPDRELSVAARSFDEAARLMVGELRAWQATQELAPVVSGHNYDNLVIDLLRASDDGQAAAWVKGFATDLGSTPNHYEIGEDGTWVIIGPDRSMRPPRIRIVFHDGQEVLFDRPAARIRLVRTPEHPEPGINGSVESFADLRPGLVGNWTIEGRRWDFGRIVFVEELWQETDEYRGMRRWTRRPPVASPPVFSPVLSLLTPVDRGRLVIEASNATVLIVDFNDMTLVRRPGPGTPRRALTSSWLRGFVTGIDSRVSWALGERDWYLSPPITSINPWAATRYPARQRELLELITLTVDDENGGGLLWYLAKYGPPVDTDVLGEPDAMDSLVAELRDHARRWHNLDDAGEEYEAPLVELIDLSTNAELAQRFRDEFDAKAEG